MAQADDIRKHIIDSYLNVAKGNNIYEDEIRARDIDYAEAIRLDPSLADGEDS